MANKSLCLFGLCFVVAAIKIFCCCNNIQAKTTLDWILQVRPQKKNIPSVELPVSVGDSILFQFVHSWDNMPVKETLIVTADGYLLLSEATFSKLGAGYDTAPLSGTYRLEGNLIHITDMNIRYKTIPLRIGTVAKHKLVVNDQIFDLAAIFSSGIRVDISLKPVQD